MSFAGNLKRILSELEISDKDRIEYTEDAITIQNYVIDQLMENDYIFRIVFGGLSLGGSYLDGVKLMTLDEFDSHMKLSFAGQILPKRDEKGFVFLDVLNAVELNADTSKICAPIVGLDYYIQRYLLHAWLRDVFLKVFNSTRRVSTIRDVYILEYILQGYGSAYTIKARGSKREISFDLVPAFEFPASQFPFDIPPNVPHLARQYPWFAVPQDKSRSDDSRTFMVCAPHWEREMVKNSYNFKNVLRLMKGLKEKNGRSLPHLSSYMLKTVMLHEHRSVDWQRDEGFLLLEMWRSLVEHLRSGQLNFILAKGHNIFDRMSYQERSTCLASAEAIYNKLNDLYTQNNFSELSKLFP